METQMDPTKEFDRIKRVPPPAFLYTRLEARIGSMAEVRFTTRQMVALACAFVLVIAVNSIVLADTQGQDQNDLSTITESLGFQSNDQLYR